jgi:hypothetical protein
MPRAIRRAAQKEVRRGVSTLYILTIAYNRELKVRRTMLELGERK